MTTTTVTPSATTEYTTGLRADVSNNIGWSRRLAAASDDIPMARPATDCAEPTGERRSNDVGAGRAERDANREFAEPLGDRVSQDAVQPNHGDDECDSTEGAEQTCAGAPRTYLRIDFVLQQSCTRIHRLGRRVHEKLSSSREQSGARRHAAERAAQYRQSPSPGRRGDRSACSRFLERRLVRVTRDADDASTDGILVAHQHAFVERVGIRPERSRGRFVDDRDALAIRVL